jgi:hypothetical protein
LTLLDPDPATVASKNDKNYSFSHCLLFTVLIANFLKNVLLLPMFSSSIFYFSLKKGKNRNVNNTPTRRWNVPLQISGHLYSKVNPHPELTPVLKNLPRSPCVFRSVSSVFIFIFWFITLGVKVSDLPGPEALYEPGRKDGQTKVGGRATDVDR